MLDKLDDKVIGFLIRAKKATYAGKGAESASSRPKSHDLMYREGGLTYIDTYLGGERFFLTYGDGVSDVDIDKLLAFHKSHGKLVTLTSVNPGQRYGSLDVDEAGNIREFREKSKTDGALINGGFMVCEPGMIDFIDGDNQMLEREPLERIARAGQLMAYRHDGFWQPMDTLREKQMLEEMWAKGAAPWKVW